MTADPIHRTVAVSAAAVLTAALAVTALATEVEAAKPKPKCGGKVATIVGTKKGEIIKGTAKADVIVARGGHDRIYAKGGNDLICAGLGHDTVYGGGNADTIYGQPGRDKLYGNAGNDFLAGQVGNDTLDGGIGVDTCHQGLGTGPVVRCERPLPPAPLPPPKVLVIAYTEVDGVPGYTAGDVMISRLLDTSRNGYPGPGDTVEMGRYPLDRLASGFGDWRVKSHVVDFLFTGYGPNSASLVVVGSSVTNTHFLWDHYPNGRGEGYFERSNGDNSTQSIFADGFGEYGGLTYGDAVAASLTSVSQPLTPVNDRAVNFGDQPFVEVDIYP